MWGLEHPLGFRDAAPTSHDDTLTNETMHKGEMGDEGGGDDDDDDDDDNIIFC